jgi:hypothetical protein
VYDGLDINIQAPFGQQF